MLKIIMWGQQPGFTVPDVALTGDPGVDQPVLAAANYKGGVIMAVKKSATAGRGTVVVPCDADTMVPFATLMNNGGEFAGAIGPSGSKKAPVTRQLWIGDVDAEGYDTTATFTEGKYVYCGGTTNNNIGKYTSAAKAGVVGSDAVLSAPVGICLHVPTASEPWLTVASLL